MKRIFFLFLILTLMIPASCRTTPDIVDEDLAGYVEDSMIFDPHEVDFYTSDWPADMVPTLVPEYETTGRIVGYSGVQSAMTITVADTNKEEYEAYQTAIKNNAFAVDRNELWSRDGIELTLDFLEASQSALITVTYTGALVWPEEMMMDIPPLDYGVIMELNTPTADQIEMHIERLTKAHAQLWFDLLVAEGFQRTSSGYVRDDAEITLIDYNYGEWGLKITLTHPQ